MRLVYQGAAPWKTVFFLRGRVELFAGGWVGWCWIPKKDDAENEKNDYKTDDGNKKGKYKHLAWCNLIYKKVFSLSSKDSYKLLKMIRVSCNQGILSPWCNV